MTSTNTLGIRNGNQIIPYAAGSPMPAGTIVSYGAATAPTGWAICDGSEKSITTYSELYARIGTTWNTCTNPLTGVANSAPSGGNFRIPDLRGTFLRGVGDFTDNTMDTVLGGFQANKTAKNGLTAAMSGSVASGTANLGTQTANHTHTPTNMQTSAANPSGGAAGLYQGATFPFTTATSVEVGNHSHNDSGHAHTVGTLAATINAGDSETRPQNVGVNYLIKLYDNLANADVYIPAASATETGLVSTAAQTIAGVKTFSAMPALATNTPATAGAAGITGQIAWDASYIYVCVATNSWKRAGIAAGW